MPLDGSLFANPSDPGDKNFLDRLIRHQFGVTHPQDATALRSRRS